MPFNLEKLAKRGDDQLGDLYSIEFPQGLPPNGRKPANLTFRMNKDLAMAPRKVAKYKVWFQGQFVEKASNVDETDKNFSVEVSCDQDWETWDAFDEWYRSVFDDYNGIAGGDSASRTMMLIRWFAPDKTTVKRLWSVYYVILFELEPPKGNHEDGAAVMFKPSFGYTYAKW